MAMSYITSANGDLLRAEVAWLAMVCGPDQFKDVRGARARLRGLG